MFEKSRFKAEQRVLPSSIHCRANLVLPFHRRRESRDYLRGLVEVKIKNLFMLSVRISSFGCTREAWRARKMRESSSRRSREQL